jgi:hypothetical protein
MLCGCFFETFEPSLLFCAAHVSIDLLYYCPLSVKGGHFNMCSHTDKMSLLRKVQLAEVDEHAFEKITPKDLVRAHIF